MGEELFHHDDVVRVTQAIVRSKGVRNEEDVEDAVADAQTACIAYVRKTGKPPATVAEACTITRFVTESMGNDMARRRNRRARTNAGATDEADEHAAPEVRVHDPLDAARMLDAARDALGAEALADFEALAAGVSQKELAAEKGISHASMRQGIARSRRSFRELLGRRGMSVLLPATGGTLVLAVLVWLALARRGEERAGPGLAPSAPSQVPVQVQPPELASAQAHAADLETAGRRRAQAGHACAQQQWEACQILLDDAWKLDPEGEKTDAVKALRAQAARGLEEQERRQNSKY